MKRGTIISLIVVVVLAVILIWVFYPFGEKPSPTTCAKAGEVSSNPSLGPDHDPDRECCEGLIEISAGMVYDPDNEMADENGCAIRIGGGLICSDCGNGNCEQWENRCNCPEDCL